MSFWVYWRQKQRCIDDAKFSKEAELDLSVLAIRIYTANEIEPDAANMR